MKALIYLAVDLSQHNIKIDLISHEYLPGEFYAIVKYKDQQIHATGLSDNKEYIEECAKKEAYNFLKHLSII